jgi:hypothetical protein
MQNEFDFDGFQELIELPLGKKDPRSFEIIKNAFHDAKHPPHDHFHFLIQQLVGKKYRGLEARDHWRRMLRHKENLEAKLGRRVGIHAAAYDYFDTIEKSTRVPGSLHALSSDRQAPIEAVNQDELINRICSPGNHFEIFKKEVFRAKRYKHSLSAIMLDVDDFQSASQLFSDKQGDGILTVPYHSPEHE